MGWGERVSYPSSLLEGADGGGGVNSDGVTTMPIIIGPPHGCPGHLCCLSTVSWSICGAVGPCNHIGIQKKGRKEGRKEY